MYCLEFEISGLTKQTNRISKNNWRTVAGQAKIWKRRVQEAIPFELKPKSPLHKAKIVYTRCSSKEPDFDGLVSGFKFIQDGLKEAGIILDDKMSVIGQPIYLWETAKPGQGKLKIRVEEC